MRYIATILVLLIGLIYWPLNLIYLKVQKLYLPLWQKDKFLYYAIAPFYWIMVAIVSIVSIPYEELTKLASH